MSQICWKLHICSSWGFTNFAIWQIWNATILKQSVNSSSGYREKIASKFGYIDEFGYIDNTQQMYWQMYLRMKTLKVFQRNWLEWLLCDRYHLAILCSIFPQNWFSALVAIILPIVLVNMPGRKVHVFLAQKSILCPHPRWKKKQIFYWQCIFPSVGISIFQCIKQCPNGKNVEEK